MSEANGRAHRAAMTVGTAEIAARLQAALGQRLVAYAVGIRTPKLVGRWAARAHVPSDAAATRLREVYRVVLLVGDEAPETLRAWMMGSNPHLGDEAPIECLRAGRAREVFQAAEEFGDAVAVLARPPRVVLPGDGPLCDRCGQHQSRHVPGPPSPPRTRGVLGSTRERPAICNDFKEARPHA